MSSRIIRKGTVWTYKNRTGPGTIVEVLFSHTVNNVTWIAFMPVHRTNLGGVMVREKFTETFTWLSNNFD